MLRIFLPLSKPSGIIRITGDKARYLSAVLRCKEGDDLLISDGKGTLFRSTINRVTPREVLAEIIGSTRSDTESLLNIVLIQGLLKGEKMDLVIQKTTELGIKEIIPAITERSIVKETRKTERWKKIAEDAARQCGRTCIPVISNSINFDDVFLRFQHLSRDEFKGLIFWEQGGIKLSKALDRIKKDILLIIAIGPEGGLTEIELKAAKDAGYDQICVSPHVLRVETAALAMAAVVGAMLDDER
jgi:16S rRNA (uracil1498-N3)-methyltransferase